MIGYNFGDKKKDEDGRICRIAVHIFRILMKNEKVKRKRLFRGSNLRGLCKKMF